MNKSIHQSIKILYVEDDDIARENAVEYLQNDFEHIIEARDALEALRLCEQEDFHIIITDIQMPKLNGLEFIERIRQKDEKTQVIVISAFSHKEYLLKAIELKLVKYLIKPVNEYELQKALDSAITSIVTDTSNIFQLSPTAYFDIFNQSLLIDDELVKLRTKELQFLSLLCKNSNRYVTYEEIENAVWSDSGMSKDALKTLVKNIKNKLPENSIVNLSGMGYKINV